MGHLTGSKPIQLGDKAVEIVLTSRHRYSLAQCVLMTAPNQVPAYSECGARPSAVSLEARVLYDSCANRQIAAAAEFFTHSRCRCPHPPSHLHEFTYVRNKLTSQ